MGNNMLPQSQPRKKRNSSKVNLMISFTFHALIVLVALYFAARQGLLGKQMKKISIEMVKEKPPEKPKEEPPKVETPKPEPAKMVEEAKAAPPVSGPPTVAPPAAELPSFEFEGGKAVETSSDPVHLYKGYLDYALRSKWQRPENVEDDMYVLEVAVTVVKKGTISDPVWEKGSGDTKWDESVKAVFKEVRTMDRPPPTNFPSRVTIRFDVQEETEPVLQ